MNVESTSCVSDSSSLIDGPESSLLAIAFISEMAMEWFCIGLRSQFFSLGGPVEGAG